MKNWIIALTGVALATPASAFAQQGIDLHSAIAASVLDDMIRERRAEREAKRQPYASPAYGPIATAEEARSACEQEILAEVGNGASITGTSSASSMSSGWEVEGRVASGDDSGSFPFVCSVRNGLVSGTLINRGEPAVPPS